MALAKLFQVASALALFTAAPAFGLPVDGGQCEGYSYSRSLVISRSADNATVVATSTIGGFSPCSYATSVQVNSPSRQGTPVRVPPTDYDPAQAQATGSLPFQQEYGTYTAQAQYWVQDDTVYPDIIYHCSNSKQLLVKPIVTGSNTVWWFNGQNPANYPTRVTLSADSGSVTSWTVTQGSNKVTVSPV